MSGGGTTAWEAERTVSAERAADLIGARFPRLRGATVEALATGWDNTVFLVGGEWIFRFPRRSVALPGVRRELAVLPRLAPRLPLPVPVPEFAGRPSPEFPWPFWGARRVPGRELAEAGLPDGARTAAAAGLGAFLRALHDPGLVSGLEGELPRDPLSRAEPSVRAPMARERLARLAAAGVWAPDPAVERLLRDGERLGTSSAPVVVSHGDLHIRHLLVDPESGEAAGVIDWGDLCAADPAVDLSLAYGGFAGPARTALLSAYGPVGAERELRARVLAVFLCAALAEYAADTGRERLLAEALAGLGRAVAD
ncbi:phosphotransferase [Actinoallomurus iriomotensis]|uniref:Aminoglycoside phosphotransferase n=1 Tax=Actinoallomurus iriomotensis TaxID=478107 RepID=A0A9W6VSS2_9ACTN|nr:phosphotransferase [Actinoallomurus iriomotensis]GLY77812.1 aminoglycoside phosphotransferase [Actinoallomurus iriomotensis]